MQPQLIASTSTTTCVDRTSPRYSTIGRTLRERPLQKTVCIDRPAFTCGPFSDAAALVAASGPWLGNVTEGWTKLTSVARLVSTREIKGKTTTSTRYYISSLPPDAREIGRAVREHWRIENTLHWSLDVVFKEDSIRIRKDNSPENLAIIRRIAFSLAKERTPQKMTTKRAQLRSILNPKFAEEHFFKE